MKPRLLTRKEVAKLLGISPSGVKRMVRAGLLREGRKLLGSLKWHREDVMEIVHRLRYQDISLPEAAQSGPGQAKSKSGQKSG